MLNRSIPILIALAVILTACGPQATPTMNPAEVQGTAVAAAWTMVAQTQAAIPTATPMPPTATSSPTSLPTFTPMPLVGVTGTAATSAVGILPTATTASGEDNCLHPIDFGAAGPTSPIRIENVSGGTITVSINLWKKNAFGQCGALSIAGIRKNAQQVIDLPKGLYFAYAWISFPDGSSGTAAGNFELRVADVEMLRLIVGPEVIGFKP